MIGGEVAFDRRDEVYEYDTMKETWSIVGRMQHKRAEHAVSLVKTEDIVDYCVDIRTTTTTTTSVTTTSTSSEGSDTTTMTSVTTTGFSTTTITTTTTAASGSSEIKDFKSKMVLLLFLMQLVVKIS